MNICDKKENKSVALVTGNLYKYKGNDTLYMACITDEGKQILLNMKESSLFEYTKGTWEFAVNRGWWEDVTDQYCLQKVK